MDNTKHGFWNYRVAVAYVTAVAVLIWSYCTDPDGGKDTLLRLQYVGWAFVVSWPMYLLRRALMDGARGREAYQQAMKTPIGAGLVFLGLSMLTGMLFLGLVGLAHGGELPPRALTYLPVLDDEISRYWPDAPMRSALGAQVEQETCPSLTHRMCWSPGAELRTPVEYGFGLGQLTVTKRFDNFAEVKKLDVSLRDWQWADRYDARRQLRAMVLMDRAGYRRLAAVNDPLERLAMAVAAYNGGMGGVQADRRLCGQVPGCDPGRWFGHVERHSLKGKVAAKGYGKSFFEINRGYVRAVLIDRRPRYAEWFARRSV